MKLVREHIFEKFTEDSDPMEDMNIGTLGHIKKDLEKIGWEKDRIIIMDDYTILRLPEFTGSSYKTDNLLQIQLKYLPKEKLEFVTNFLTIKKNSPDITKELTVYLKKALKDKISPKDIKILLGEFTGNEIGAGKILKTYGIILLSKLTRTKDQKEFDNEYNTYAFIGYMDKSPVEIKGKKYYEDKFQVEKMIKIDKYNLGDLHSLEAMKLRVQYSDHTSSVYTVSLPKFMMNEDEYAEIPDIWRDMIEKYKKRI